MPEAESATDLRMALAREWDDRVEEVRRAGFNDFLRPLPLDVLLPAAAEGPVVIVNVSESRCDALIVRTTGVTAQELPSLTLKEAYERTIDYLRVLEAVDGATLELFRARKRYDYGDHSANSVRRYQNAKTALQRAARERDTTLAAVLEWLWDVIAEPALAAADVIGPPARGRPWPRLWWCPTGPLTLLPLHAAGYHDEPGRAAARSVLDRVISSYTPTLQALIDARRPLLPPLRDERMLIVALPDTPGQVPLPDAARERELICTLFPSRHTLIEGSNATVGAVRDALARHRWAHFSCHGGQNLADPSRGGLLLNNGVLSVADIGAGRHDGEFAFLSACMTAVGGARLADEAVTLAAAMHHTGYRRVIGTLWSVYDRTAVEVAEAVYAELTVTGQFVPARSAEALHAAIRRLRDVEQLPSAVWSPFTHTGP